jgi:hypothetical protein
MAAYGSIVDSDKPRTTYFVSDASVIQQPAHLILRVAALHALQRCLILSLRGARSAFLVCCIAGVWPPGWARSETNLNRGPHDPRQDIEARQSLSARPVRADRLGCTDQAEELGASWAQALDRSGQETAASQRACDCSRQQAGPHRLERSRSWSSFRGKDEC